MRRILKLYGTLMLVTAFVAQSARGQIGGLGAIGDSLTDEYAEEDYDYAANWFEQLVECRGIDAGPTAAEANEPNGTWGEPRRTGYQYNWARWGATTQDAIDPNHPQHTGLAALVDPNQITHATIWIGVNDILVEHYGSIAYGEYTDEQIEAIIQQFATNLEVILDTVEATDVDLVLGNLVDIGFSPFVISWFGDPVQRQRVQDVFARMNQRVDRISRAHELPLVDMFRLWNTIFGTHQSPNIILVIGNQNIRLDLCDNSLNERLRRAWVHDCIHPHPTIQGIHANVFIEAFNRAYDTQLELFTEEELLAHRGCGLPYGGADTLADQIGAYSDYVYNYSVPACRADLDHSGTVDLADLAQLLTDYGCVDEYCPGDVDGDGDVELADLAALLAVYGTPCP
jgi:hypothetical protein